MSDAGKDHYALTRQQAKILDAGDLIRNDRTTCKEAAYMARQLVQCTLPHKNPGDIPAWSRKNGNLTLTIRPGWDSRKKESYGYPYGTIPRLLLFWMVSEAVQTKSPRLELGRSLSGFMAELGLDSSRGGKRSDATRLKSQMERLFNSVISFDGDVLRDGVIGQARLNMVVAEESMLWWNPKQPQQETFDSHVELGRRFFEAITAAPVPVDMRALQALKKSPLALDLYAWLTYQAYRAHKTGKSRFTSYAQLHAQMGGDYVRLDDFRKKVRAALVKIRVVYPDLKLGEDEEGIDVLPESLPALQPRHVIGKPGQKTAFSSPSAKSGEELTQERFLRPTTIDRFRHRYPGLDPYACKADFNAWLEEKGASHEPRSYDGAFLGFADKWAGKKKA